MWDVGDEQEEMMLTRGVIIGGGREEIRASIGRSEMKRGENEGDSVLERKGTKREDERVRNEQGVQECVNVVCSVSKCALC